MPEARPAFQALQYAFAAYLRDPDNQPAPAGIEARRMKIYAELFFKNIESYLANAFPVLRSLYADAAWLGLVRGYYARHVSHSPQFYQIGEEFLRYLQREHENRKYDPPFLLELAHYEWVEMILAIDPREPPAVNPAGDLLQGCPVVTPWLKNLAYAYDVHRITTDYQPVEPPPQPTHLAVFRRADGEIRFLEMNAMTARLLQGLIDAPGKTGHEQLMTLAPAGAADAQSLLGFGAELLEDLRRRQVVLGTSPA